jgi:hypothetical protein
MCVCLNVVLISAEIPLKWTLFLNLNTKIYMHIHFTSYALHASHNILIFIGQHESIVSSTNHEAFHYSVFPHSLLPHTSQPNIRMFSGISLLSFYF